MVSWKSRDDPEWQILEAGVNGAGSLDDEKIAAWLKKNRVTTVYGSLRFDGAYNHGDAAQFIDYDDDGLLDLVHALAGEEEQRGGVGIVPEPVARVPLAEQALRVEVEPGALQHHRRRVHPQVPGRVQVVALGAGVERHRQHLARVVDIDPVSADGQQAAELLKNP